MATASPNSMSFAMESILGGSQKTQDVCRLIERVANTAATVLITGECGTGKELIAKAIHQGGCRRLKPFVAINCASIPEALLESELFGHARGAFTGAHQDRKGLFQEADGGTLFLDEIGDLSFNLQAKLLRVLQDKKVKAVGENSFKQIEVRILAATHKSLDSLIKQNLFREDLYYRLNVISINAPPLRERPEDIPFLAEHFLSKFSLAHKSCAKAFSPQALEYLLQHKWPGNIRELENLIERAVILCRGEEIQVEDLHGIDPDIRTAEGSPSEIIQKFSESGYLTLNDFVMCYIDFILGKTGGKKEKAARILQIDRSTLHRKLLEYSRAGHNHDKGAELSFIAQAH